MAGKKKQASKPSKGALKANGAPQKETPSKGTEVFEAKELSVKGSAIQLKEDSNSEAKGTPQSKQVSKTSKVSKAGAIASFLNAQPDAFEPSSSIGLAGNPVVSAVPVQEGEPPRIAPTVTLSEVNDTIQPLSAANLAPSTQQVNNDGNIVPEGRWVYIPNYCITCWRFQHYVCPVCSLLPQKVPSDIGLLGFNSGFDTADGTTKTALNPYQPLTINPCELASMSDVFKFSSSLSTGPVASVANATPEKFLLGSDTPDIAYGSHQALFPTESEGFPSPAKKRPRLSKVEQAGIPALTDNGSGTVTPCEQGNSTLQKEVWEPAKWADPNRNMEIADKIWAGMNVSGTPKSSKTSTRSASPSKSAAPKPRRRKANRKTASPARESLNQTAQKDIGTPRSTVSTSTTASGPAASSGVGLPFDLHSCIAAAVARVHATRQAGGEPNWVPTDEFQTPSTAQSDGTLKKQN
ncbi:MAG: hypothetical protein M1814_003397 [Vezdaea aestivalis]|nr:MAG: hypothetical protein M1814_003397 [Vezdaea aestivalis]